MGKFLQGAGLSLVINALTILGWVYIGPLIPAAINALVALLIIGIWGLENKWAFPLGYWAVQLLGIMFWVTGISAVAKLLNS